LYLKISTDIAVFIYNKQQYRKTEENLVTKVSCMETEPIIIQMNNKSPFIKENIELVKRKTLTNCNKIEEKFGIYVSFTEV